MTKFLGKVGTVFLMVLFFGYGLVTLSLPVEAGVLCLSKCINDRASCLAPCTSSGNIGHCQGMCVVKYDLCVMECDGFML